MNELKMEKHPDKTFIGRIDRGFDFLGYRFERTGLTIALKTQTLFLDWFTRLHEQGAGTGRVGQYVRNWRKWWATAGVDFGEPPLCLTRCGFGGWC